MDASQLSDAIAQWGYVVLLPLSVLEGPIVTMSAGWLTTLGILSVWPVLLCVVLGDLIGDSMLYAAGRWFRHRPMPMIGRRLRLNPWQLHRILRRFRTQDVRVLLFGKFAHAPGAPILFAAGMARIPFGRFLLVNLLATLPKSAAMIVAGRLLGTAIGKADSWIGWGSLALLVIGLAIWLAVRLLQDKRMPWLT